jgi:hypothetical protein
VTEPVELRAALRAAAERAFVVPPPEPMVVHPDVYREIQAAYEVSDDVLGPIRPMPDPAAERPYGVHDGPCCDSCIEDVNTGAQEPFAAACCCRGSRAAREGR